MGAHDSCFGAAAVYGYNNAWYVRISLFYHLWHVINALLLWLAACHASAFAASGLPLSIKCVDSLLNCMLMQQCRPAGFTHGGLQLAAEGFREVAERNDYNKEKCDANNLIGFCTLL